MVRGKYVQKNEANKAICTKSMKQNSYSFSSSSSFFFFFFPAIPGEVARI